MIEQIVAAALTDRRCVSCKTPFDEATENGENVTVLGDPECVKCGSFDFEDYRVDEAMVEAALELGEQAAMIVERFPELRSRVEAALEETRRLTESILP